MTGDMSYEEWKQKAVDRAGEPEFIRISNINAQNRDTAGAIGKELSMIPEKHKKLVESTIEEIQIVSNGHSRYDRINKIMHILKNLYPGEVTHEIAHLIETELKIYDDPQFIGIIRDTFEGKTIREAHFDVDYGGNRIWLSISGG